MLEFFHAYIEKNKLFERKDKLLLALSGGLDSMALASLLSESGYTFSIAHCNFKLRGKESDEDELFITRYAKRINVKSYVGQFNTRDYAGKNKISIQMAARELRYNWFEKIRKDNGYDYVLIAQHADDHMETVLINLIRGTGIAGFHGIKPRQDNVIRPLLWATRSQLEAYVKNNNIPYRTDSSNETNDYLRNGIRHNLIPLLKTFNPDFSKSFRNTIHRLSAAEMIFQKEIDRACRDVCRCENEQFIISIHALKMLAPVEIYLYEFLKPFGFNFSVVSDMINQFQGEPGKLFYSQTHRVLKDRELFIVEPYKDISDKSEIYWLKENQQRIDIPITLVIEKVKKRETNILNESKQFAYIDFDMLSFPLLLRKWEKGDHFYPLGMKNKKLLSDFFTDEKLTLFEKEKTWVLLSDGKIVWVVGHRIDDRFKIKSNTRNILVIQKIQ